MDYISKIYNDLEGSKELSNLRNMMKKLEENISEKKFNELDSILDNSVISDLLWATSESLVNIIKELLGELYDEDEIRIYGTYKYVEIRRAFEKINHYYYAKNSSSSPSSYLLKIDFENKQIIVYDTKKEYEIANKYFLLNLEEYKTKVEDQEKIVKNLDKYDDVMECLTKEFSFFNTIDYIKLKLNSTKRAKYNELFLQKKEREHRYLEGIKENLNEDLQKDFISDYNEMIIIRDKILDKLKPLQFELVTEVIDYGEEDYDEI